jgi:hypothetical protein
VYRFRYVYVSNGESGFLLDLIETSDATQLRLLWCHSGTNRVLRAANAANTQFDETLAQSTLAGLHYEIHFELEAGSERFGPAWVPRLLPRVPEFHSKYGRLTHATVLGVSLRELALGYSWYSVKNVAEARWLLVSALEFSGTDLRFELTAVQVGNSWLGAIVIRYQCVTHRLNGLSSSWRVSIVDAGARAADQRKFAARAKAGDLELAIEAAAPLADFVLLEDHGPTRIETTLFGDCEVRVRTTPGATPVLHRAARTCLLELKS